MQPDDSTPTPGFLDDVLRSLSPRPAAESAIERALRDGGDSPRDPNAPDEAALALVRAAARQGRPEDDDETFIGPTLADLQPASLVAAEAGCTCSWYDDGDGESGPHVAVAIDDACPLHGDDEPPTRVVMAEPLRPLSDLARPSSSDPRVNEALGGIDSDDVFKIAFTQRYGVL